MQFRCCEEVPSRRRPRGPRGIISVYGVRDGTPADMFDIGIPAGRLLNRHRLAQRISGLAMSPACTIMPLLCCRGILPSVVVVTDAADIVVRKAHLLELVLLESVEGGLEVVQNDGICQTLEDEGEFPEGVQTVW